MMSASELQRPERRQTEHLRRHGAACASRGERGVVIPLVAFSFAVFIVALALVLDTGLMVVTKSQAQNVADAAARAAMLTIAHDGADFDGAALIERATRNAREVARSTSMLQGGVNDSNAGVPSPATNQFGDIEIIPGDYDFDADPGKRFTPSTDASLPPRAMRVIVRRNDSTPSGPIQRLVPMSRNDQSFDLTAESIATLRCRNIVFLVDVSVSFAEDIGRVQSALRETIGDLRDPDHAAIVAFRNQVVSSATSTRLVPGDEKGDILSLVDRLSDPAVKCELNFSIFDVFGDIQLPACVGTDMAAAVGKAVDLLQEGNGRSASCEDVVILMSDGLPCPIPEELVERNLIARPRDDSEQRAGGSTVDATRDAAKALTGGCSGLTSAACRSLASIAINQASADTPGQSCPVVLNDGEPLFEAAQAIFEGRRSGLFASLSPVIDFSGSESELASVGLSGTEGSVARLSRDTYIFTATNEDANIDREFMESMIGGEGQFFISEFDARELEKQMNRALSTLGPALVR
jgi:hypothetical protein